MRQQSATAHELARIALLADLPGEMLVRLGERMERRQLAAGEKVQAAGRFYVVLSGMLTGSRGALRPGDALETGEATAVMPATVASCDRATYDELVAPHVKS